MRDPKRRRLDVAALSLAAVAVFLAVALFTYNPADPPNRLVYPPQMQSTNACGRVGAITAAWMFGALGLGAFYVVSSLGLGAVLIWRRRPVDDRFLRGGGWLLSLAAVVTLAAMALPHASPGPVIGAGGYVGAVGRGLLVANFSAMGAYLLTISLLLGGLMLFADYTVFRIAGRVLALPTVGVVRTIRRRDRQATSEEADDVAEEEDYDEEELEGDEEDDEAYDEYEYEYESDDEDEDETDGRFAVRIRNKETDADEEKPPRKSVKERLAAKLKIHSSRERQEVIEQLEEPDSNETADDYELPSRDLLLDTEPFNFDAHEKEVRRKARLLEKTFTSFGFRVRVVEIETGPVIAQFEVELEAGLRLSKITGLADDLAIALRVPSVRIVAPIPGKNTVGIEVPNSQRQLVRMREVIEEGSRAAAKMRIPIFLGKDVSGSPTVVDLATLPHLLIAGRTGTGKSVCLNSIIMSMLFTRRPDEVKMLLIDPKMVELSPYMRLPHLMHPVVTDMKKAEAILAWAVDKMEERYSLLARSGVRHVSVYNQLGEEELLDRLQPASDEERASIPRHLPYIVIVADELADLMMTAAKEVESHIIRLAQKSRAVGIHLVLATQKPSVDVITGLIKSNLPARISFQVASRTDSRVVLDEMGADKLLGNGDMLFLWPGTSALLRGQGAFVSDDEIGRVVDCVGTSEPQFAQELVLLEPGDSAKGGKTLRNRDELYEAAVDIVVREGRGSVSLLQRSLGIGYGRAARLIDYMAEDQIVGQYNGSQAREVLISVEEWASMSGVVREEPAKASRRRKRIVVSDASPRSPERRDVDPPDDGDSSTRDEQPGDSAADGDEEVEEAQTTLADDVDNDLEDLEVEEYLEEGEEDAAAEKAKEEEEDEEEEDYYEDEYEEEDVAQDEAEDEAEGDAEEDAEEDYYEDEEVEEDAEEYYYEDEEAEEDSAAEEEEDAAAEEDEDWDEEVDEESLDAEEDEVDDPPPATVARQRRGPRRRADVPRSEPPQLRRDRRRRRIRTV